MSNSKHRAKLKGLEHDLDLDWVLERLDEGRCEATDITFSYDPPINGRKRNGFSPSIERRNPLKGYTRDNCQIVCTSLNVAKAELTAQEFDLLCLAYLRKRKLV